MPLSALLKPKRYFCSELLHMKINILVVACCISLILACKPEQKTSTLHTTGDPAVDKLSRQIAQEPDNAELYFMRGDLFYNKALYDEAIADFESAISRDSLQADYYHMLSNAFMDYYKSKQSLQVMEEAALLFPDRIQTLLKLSETQLILKKHEDMNITLRRIISKDPQNAEAYFMMGMMYRSSEDIEKAKNAFQASIEFDPELLDAWLILGSIYEAEKNPIALQYYKSASEIDTNNVLALHSMAFYMQNNGRIEEALEIYRRIISINRTYPDAYLNTGILLLEQSKPNLALEQFDILVGVSPQNPLAYYYRALANEQLSNLDAARSDYQTALNFDPDFDKAQRALSQIKANQ